MPPAKALMASRHQFDKAANLNEPSSSYDANDGLMALVVVLAQNKLGPILGTSYRGVQGLYPSCGEKTVVLPKKSKILGRLMLPH